MTAFRSWLATHRRVWLRSLRVAFWVVGAVLTALFVLTIVLQWRNVTDAMADVTVASLISVTLLQLASYPVRTWAWERCVRAAGAKSPTGKLHLSSAASFIAVALGPAHLSPAARLVVFGSKPDPGAPSAKHMIAADAVLAALQGVLTLAVVLVVAALGASPAELGCGVALLVCGTLALLRARRRLRGRRIRELVAVMSSPWQAAGMLATSAVLLGVQMLRWYWILRAVGFHRLSWLDSLVTFALTTATAAPLPLGPGLYPIHLHLHVHVSAHTAGHLLNLARTHAVAQATAGILILTASAVIAGLIYALGAMLLYDRAAAKALMHAMPRLPALLLRATARRAAKLAKR